MNVSMMNKKPIPVCLVLLILWGFAFCFDTCEAGDPVLRKHSETAAQEAHQAVAVDSSSFIAIASRSIGRYDKQAPHQKLGSWTAPTGSHILHLNSGLILDGKLYCANSNWPKSPLKNSIEIFSADKLTHLKTLNFDESAGAINWVDRHHEHWWVAFAFYGDEVSKSHLIQFDDDWHEVARFTFPERVLKRFHPMSNSGGGFGPDGKLYVTGHDHAELYVLDVPADSTELKYVTTIPAPITGQGIAWDRTDSGVLYGIHRARKLVVKMNVSTDEN